MVELVGGGSNGVVSVKEDATAPLVEAKLVAVPGLCQQGPESFLAVCLQLAEVQGSAAVFEKPIVEVRTPWARREQAAAGRPGGVACLLASSSFLDDVVRPPVLLWWWVIDGGCQVVLDFKWRAYAMRLFLFFGSCSVLVALSFTLYCYLGTHATLGYRSSQPFQHGPYLCVDGA